MESAREDATQATRPSGRSAMPRGPCTSVEGRQPGVVAAPEMQETRVSPPLAGSRRNDVIASSSVPATSTVWPLGETATAEARPSPPTTAQSARGLSLKQPAPGACCVSVPAVMSRWNAVSEPAADVT